MYNSPRFAWGRSREELEIPKEGPWDPVDRSVGLLSHRGYPGYPQSSSIFWWDFPVSTIHCKGYPPQANKIMDVIRQTNLQNWLVVWNTFYFPIYLEWSSQLTNIFQKGSNHQPGKVVYHVLIFATNEEQFIQQIIRLCCRKWWICFLYISICLSVYLSVCIYAYIYK